MTATATFNSTASCPSCHTDLAVDATFCEACGEYLVDEFDEALAEFQPKADAAALWLGFLAILAFVSAGVFFAIDERALESTAWLNAGLGAVYLGLAGWALKDPYSAAITALVLWLTTQAINFFVMPESLGSGIPLKVIIFIGLMRAIHAGQMVRIFRAQNA